MIGRMSNYPSGFKDGLNLRGMPLFQTHTGRVLWVGNSSSLGLGTVGGTDGSDGTYNRPLSTLDRAFALAKAGVGDIIMVKPGHAEVLTDASLAFDIAGVAVIGLGSGIYRPKLTFGAAAANIPLTAGACSLSNFQLVANFADVVSMFTVTGTALAADFSLDGCDIRDTSSILNALTVITGNATANSLDGLRVTNNVIRVKGTTAATTAIKLAAAVDRITINGNRYTGAVLDNVAAILAHGASVVTELEMGWNVVFRANTDTATGALLITTTSVTNTGIVHDNRCATVDTAGALLVTAGSKYAMIENYHIGDADASAIIIPGAGAN